MKKLILLLLMLMSNYCFANWESLGRSSSYEYFIDPASMRKTDAKIKVWVMYNFNPPQISSVKQFEEYDCDEFRKRIMTIIKFDGAMGSGKVIADNDYSNNMNYAPVSPDSVGHKIWKKVCLGK